MHAAGVPYEKLIRVPNCPGHPVEASVREKILAKRHILSNRRLNVLYLGRLDRQKGMERLAEVVKRTWELDLEVNWRIVGASVSDSVATPLILQDMLEQPVFDGQRLTSLFDWADVMVLLSDFEGIPLSILEAQRLGVVVIATNVGALPEIISNGVSGFLIERETAVDQTVDLLRLLSEAPALRSRVALDASSVTDWQVSARGLIDRMSAMVNLDRDPGAESYPSPSSQSMVCSNSL
jgi:glycosyltransferase involved in cell wall biosynthesis